MVALKRPCMLVVFGGLPGVGKTTLAKQFVASIRAAYIRIDTIEQKLKSQGCLHTGTEGYELAYALAAENLKLGMSAVADSVNPISITRQAWRDVASMAGAQLLEVEIICSDRAEHQRRVEQRTADIEGHELPTWAEVEARHYELWQGCDVVIDTARLSLQECMARIIAAHDFKLSGG